MNRGSIAALLLLSVLGMGAEKEPPLPTVTFPVDIAVNLHGPNAKHESTAHQFSAPVTFNQARLKVTVQVPAGFVQRPFSAVQLWAKDAERRWQNTEWTDGVLSPENPLFHVSDGTLTLYYHPTPAEISRQGWTQRGFNPEAGVRKVGVKISTPGAAPKDYVLAGTVKVLEAAVERVQIPPQEPAIVMPLLRSEAGLPPLTPAPLEPAQLKTGVSRYIVYGDLHRWDEVKARVPQIFGAQQVQGLFAFRLMGGLDIRSQSGGIRMGPREMDAMAAYLEAARAAGQRWQIVTLFDAAVGNDTLKAAALNLAARKALIDAYRPFLKRFGTAAIEGEPVVFDLVNEIHHLGGVTERQRQQLVEDLVEAFLDEAPGATVTLGIYDYDDLIYWLYLIPKYEGRPIRFVMTYHRYDALGEVPAAWELNLPKGTEVGITEADARLGIGPQLQAAAAKGYRWLLFWQDQDYSYDPQEHRQALDQLEMFRR